MTPTERQLLIDLNRDTPPGQEKLLAHLPMLEQLEELALVDAHRSEWLTKNIYQNPQALALLTNTVASTTTNE